MSDIIKHVTASSQEGFEKYGRRETVSLGAAMGFSGLENVGVTMKTALVYIEGRRSTLEDYTVEKKKEHTVTTPILPCSYAK